MFDLIPASSQYITVPATVVHKDECAFSFDLQPDFAPASATQLELCDVTTIRYQVLHYAANTWRVYADSRYKVFDVTGLWVAGQRVHVAVNIRKTGDVIQLFVNGTEITAASASGTWGTSAVGASWTIGSRYDGGATVLPFDGDLGAPAIWNRLLTATEVTALASGQPAKECALSGLIWSAPFDINAQPDWNPGGEEATVVGSPLISQHPLCLRRGARVLVEGFQGAAGATGQFENAGWVLTGTPTASTKIEGVAAPAGTDPALGAQVLQVDHADGENAIYYAKVFTEMPRGILSVYIRPTAFAAAARELVRVGRGGERVVSIYQANATTLGFYYNNGTSSQSAGSVAVAANRWYRAEMEWDVTAGKFRVWFGGTLIIDLATLLVGAADRVMVGYFSTSNAIQFQLAGLDIRSDRRPDPLYDGAFDLGGTNDYVTAPQAIAEAIADEGAFAGWYRLDTLPAETTLRNFFRADQGGSNRLRLVKSATTNLIQLYNNARVLTCTATGLWTAGQWVCIIAHWKKSTDTMEVYLNGTDISGSKTGTWGSEAISSVLGIGGHSAGNLLDGALGRIHVLSRLLTAGEIASFSDGRHAREVAPDAWVESWAPGSLTGEKGAYNLTKVGAPAIVRGPGVQDARGAVLVRSHFEGVGYEQPWTVAGTPTADTLIDPDATRPAGWPAWAGQPCRFKQLATENALTIGRTFSAADVDTLWYREVLYPVTIPGGTCSISRFTAIGGDTFLLRVDNLNLSIGYHIAAGWQYATLCSITAGKVYYVEIGYSVSGKWVAYRVNGHLGNKPYTYITNVTLDRGGARSLYLCTSTVTTYSIEMFRGAIEARTDCWPPVLNRKARVSWHGRKITNIMRQPRLRQASVR